MNSSPGRLLLIDDDVELAALMREFFSAHGFELTCAYSGSEGLEKARETNYDLILLDVMMPGLDGFAVLQRLRQSNGTPVLMLTARTEAASRIKGLESGADDYLPKPFEPRELLARIRAILRRAQPGSTAAAAGAPTPVIVVGGVRVEPASRRVMVDGAEIDVTTIEFDILETLMRSAGHVVSRDDLMQRLYHRESTPFDRSIDVHVSHLRRKLDGPRELIRTVRGVGYLFAADAGEGVAS